MEALRPRLCDELGIEHPVLNAPMGGGDAPAELAAAVSEAGGLGLIGGTTIGGAEWLIAQIRRPTSSPNGRSAWGSSVTCRTRPS